MPEDSTGKLIKIGELVKFRGRVYTIKEFLNNGRGDCGTRQIIFKEKQHVSEVACEFTVDLVF